MRKDANIIYIHYNEDHKRASLPESTGVLGAEEDFEGGRGGDDGKYARVRKKRIAAAKARISR